MAVDRELGAGAWSYFGDPRAISHDGHTFTGWISTAGNVWVARYTRGGRLSKRLLYRGLGRDDHNNPSLVFRRDGHLMVFFSPHSGHHLPPPGIPSVMRYRVALHPLLDRGVRAGPDRAHQRPRRAGLHLSEPDPAPRQAVALLARRRLEPDVLLHRGRPRVGAGPRARLHRRRGAAVRQVRRRRQPPNPRHLQQRQRAQHPQRPALPALRSARSSSPSVGAGSGH